MSASTFQDMSLFAEMGKLVLSAQVLQIGSANQGTTSSSRALSLSKGRRKGISGDETNADALLYSPTASTHNKANTRIWLRLGSDMRLYYTDRAPMNTSYSGRLQRLLRDAKHAQYLLACLSTLGGANHLCNKPRQALALAKQQEAIGTRLGSTDIVLRARAFQAVNYALLGAEPLAHALFADTVKHARCAQRESTQTFVQGLWDWLNKDLNAMQAQQQQQQQQQVEHKQDIGAFIREIEVESPLNSLLHYKYKPPVAVEVLQLQVEGR